MVARDAWIQVDGKSFAAKSVRRNCLPIYGLLSRDPPFPSSRNYCATRDALQNPAGGEGGVRHRGNQGLGVSVTATAGQVISQK